VTASDSAEHSYTLAPAPFLLPDLLTENRRRGIYGAVGTVSGKPLVGARVQAAGFMGGVVRTDSQGGFAFPSADRGAYILRITHPGYGERRFALELKARESRQVIAVLLPSDRMASRLDDQAFDDLRTRLAMSFRRNRLSRSELSRWGSASLCEVPPFTRWRGQEITVILNGVTALEDYPVSALCTWSTDQVALVEFGSLCSEVTGTLAFVLVKPSWCAATRRASRSLQGSLDRISTQRGDATYVVIWLAM
jgi:hypothetical protein